MNKYKKTLSIENLSNINITLSNQHVYDLPTVKHFFDDKTNLQPTSDLDNEATHALLENLQTADSAFVNSILSYASYKQNVWTLANFDKDISEIAEKVHASFENPQELYNFKVWNYLNNNFNKIPDTHFMRSSGLFKSEYGFDVNYNFKDGQYSSLDGLAHASVLSRKNPNGEGNILHVSFRGTDFEQLPSYIKKAYLNMTAYYENFLPLEKAILEYAKDPRNNISSIEVSGHSLGGAMAQEFLKRNPNDESELAISGYTFGSPGSNKKSYMSFLNIGFQFFKKRNIVVSDFTSNKIEQDNRLHEFYHTNDPIPKLGLLGYNRSGISYNLLDNVYHNSKEAKQEKVSILEKLPIFGKMITNFKEKYINAWKVRFHDSNRYVNNIKSIIETSYRSNPGLIGNMHNVTQGWQDFLDSDNKFRQLSIKHKNSFKAIIRAKNPNFSEEQLEQELLTYRELMKYENQTNLIIAQTGENKFYNQNFSGKNFVTQEVRLSMKELREKYNIETHQNSNLFALKT